MNEEKKCAEIRERMNLYGKKGSPFLFLFDFDMRSPMLWKLDEVSRKELLYNFPSFSNSNDITAQYPNKKVEMHIDPPTEERYKEAFNIVMKNLQHGNSYLLNLTLPSKVELNMGLEEVYFRSEAKYKLWMKDRFVFFSPEAFVNIKDGCISSYPMKGTIDADIPNAEQLIMDDPKELAEHHTIVDLIRNDISTVATNVRVERFRYIDRVETARKNLLQVSSEIKGDLPADYASRIGDIMFRLLPAGSISGAPKKKTVEVIHEAEKYDRSFYTGVCGIFDGSNMESAVIIRYLEQDGEQLWFKSGGGITVRSECQKEYEELINKVYVPISGNN